MVAWMILTVLFVVLDNITLRAYGFEPPEDFYLNAWVSLLASLRAGFLGGIFLVFVLEGWLRRMPFWRVLLATSFWFSVIFLLVSFSAGMWFYYLKFDGGLFSKDAVAVSTALIGSPLFVKGFITWFLVNAFTIFILKVSDKYGPIVFTDFLLGKYFRPVREERIFMFLDIRSSTTIAEKLGEVRYFNLLYDFIKDCTESILVSRGQIYQYVGDEIVVTWKVDRGVKQANCLRCFFNIQKAIADNAAYYQEQYGLVPEFKAGLHYGFVMAGEIGLVKKDIAFSGDVLNTTARIQSMCNQMGVDILLSKYLLDRIPKEEEAVENARFMGDIELRGKRKRVMLYTV